VPGWTPCVSWPGAAGGENQLEPSPSPPEEPPLGELAVDDEPADDDAAIEDPAIAVLLPVAAAWVVCW